MTVYSGNSGSLKVGANALGQVLNFEIKQSGETIRTDTMGDTWNEHIAGKLAWSGSAECLLDSSDTAQTALVVGASVVLEVYPDGNTTGRIKLSGTATVTAVDTSADQDDANSRSFEFEGNGALTTGAAS